MEPKNEGTPLPDELSDTKAVCDFCNVVRTVSLYESGSLEDREKGVGAHELCASCASVSGARLLEKDHLGRLLLEVNSKLDLLLGKPR